jgi:hypothetical protein
VPADDPALARFRKASQPKSEGDHVDQGSHNETEHGDGHRLDARGAAVYGIYECMHWNFVAPCKWTQIKSESQCYNM